MDIKTTFYNTTDVILYEDTVNSIKELFITYDRYISYTFGHLRKYLDNFLLLNGWSEKIKIDEGSNMTVPAIKNKVGLSFQTGNAARFYSDMLKFQTLYIQNRLDSLIYIVPQNNLATHINTNTANYERVVKELDIFRNIINMPIVIIGITNKED
ncbi:MAG: Restriction endonuclease BglII [Herbinix sp.]|jgi:hypothetical protein|nr:Restriction endonuclease BglII [Herbinix sp.]